MKKLIALILSIILMVSLFSGCTQNDGWNSLYRDMNRRAEQRKKEKQEANKYNSYDSYSSSDNSSSSSSKKSSTGSKSKELPTEDFDHQDDFYDWYYDDFYDYEEAEDYYLE